MQEKRVIFNSRPEEGAVIVAGGFPVRVESGWHSPERHSSNECDPTPLREFLERHYPECTRIHAVSRGEIKCACGFEAVFDVWLCK